tara:strand:- start:812 stop:2656 length:1845 start_codon:yes stop_codon:yes gene_type:complete
MSDKKDLSNLSKEKLISIIEEFRKKKYGLFWDIDKEEIVEKCKTEYPYIKELKNKEIKINKNLITNALIEGDNYHSVSVLNITHKKKIDVIYIDPPYNTGAQNWKYNNKYVDSNHNYPHSRWIQMMSSRLEVAKNLLKDDGVLICAIDENELNRLGLLLESIFREYKIHPIAIVHNPRGKQGKNFKYTHEYAYFCIPKNISDEEDNKEPKIMGDIKIDDEDIEWRSIRDAGTESDRTDAKNCFYPIIVKNEKIINFGEVLPLNKKPKTQTEKKGDEYYIWPIDTSGNEKKWTYARQTIESIKNLLRVKKTKNGYNIEKKKEYKTHKSVWTGPTVFDHDTIKELRFDTEKIFSKKKDINEIKKAINEKFKNLLSVKARYDASEYGTKINQKLVSNTNFPFPKSVYTVYDCIYPIVKNKKDAIILDFFAGSGTTGHAVSLMNKNDGGERQFILCTNNESNDAENENKIAIDECYPKIKSIIEGNKKLPEITGIKSNLKYYQIEHQSSEFTDSNKLKIFNNALDMILLKENTFDKILDEKNIKIYKNSKNFYTFIVKDELEIEKIKKIIPKYTGKIKIYVFSIGNDNYEDVFYAYKDVETTTFSQEIINTYRNLFND